MRLVQALIAGEETIQPPHQPPGGEAFRGDATLIDEAETGRLVEIYHRAKTPTDVVGEPITMAKT